VSRFQIRISMATFAVLFYRLVILVTLCFTSGEYLLWLSVGMGFYWYIVVVEILVHVANVVLG
jgi:hypothetical protein